LPADVNDDAILYLDFDEGGAADTDAKPELTYTADTGDLDDTAFPANALADIANGDLTETDKAAPTVITVAGEVDGTIDAGNIQSGEVLTFTFSEAVTVTGSSLDENDIVATYDGTNPVTTSGTAFDGVELTFAQGAGDTMTVTFGADTTSSDGATYAGSVQQGKWNSSADFNLASGIVAGQIKGVAENLPAVPNDTDVNSTNFDDQTQPTFVSGVTTDSDDDGYLNVIKLMFSEKLTVDATYDEEDITILTVHNGAGAQDLATNNAIITAFAVDGTKRSSCC